MLVCTQLLVHVYHPLWHNFIVKVWFGSIADLLDIYLVHICWNVEMHIEISHCVVLWQLEDLASALLLTVLSLWEMGERCGLVITRLLNLPCGETQCCLILTVSYTYVYQGSRVITHMDNPRFAADCQRGMSSGPMFCQLPTLKFRETLTVHSKMGIVDYSSLNVCIRVCQSSSETTSTVHGLLLLSMNMYV